MRRSLAQRTGALPGAAVLSLMMVGSSCLGVSAHATVKPKAAAKAVALPNGHVGQEYQTRIRGISGPDVISFHCDPDPVVLPKGLALDCKRMLIHGHPEEATPDPAKPAEVKFTVADDEGHSVPVNLTLTILDGPDEVNVASPTAAGARVGAAAGAGAGVRKKEPKPTGAAVTESAPDEEQATETPTTEPGMQRPASISAFEPAAAAEVATVPASAPTLTPSPGARILPTVSVVSHESGPLNAGGVTGAGAAADGGYSQQHGHREDHGVGIEIRKETPVVEGATEIDGRIMNDSERISGLCVGLRQKDTTVKLGSGDSYAAVTPPSGSKCPSVYVPVDKDTNEFMLKLKEPLRGGVDYLFDVWSTTTEEAIPVRGMHPYKISVQLPKPTIEVTSLIRDGVSTITGTCNNLPSPAVATNASAKPAVTGNLPRVVVELHEPEAPSAEWHTADLVVGKGSAQSEEAQASADGCTFNVTLKAPLAAGQTVRVKLKAPAGRKFGALATDTEATWPAGADRDNGKGTSVFTALAVAPPVITSLIKEGASSITGTATPSPSTGAVTIAAISDDDYYDKSTTSTPGATLTPSIEACRSAEEMTEYSGRYLPLADGSSAATSTAGAFTVKLATALEDGQRFHLVEVLPARSQLTEAEKKKCKTTITEVKGDLDWGRIHADFVGGVLISNDSTNSTVTTTTTGSTGTTNTTTSAGAGNFSQAHQFYALNVEKSWALPGCYLRVFGHGEVQREENGEVAKDPNGSPIVNHVPDQCFDWGHGKLIPAKRRQHYEPGFNTYFQTRLTAIPVSTVSTSGSNAGTVSSSGGNLISSAQTARVEVGTYFPFFVTRWEYDHKPNALFFAPLAKTGFDTVTGPSTVNTVAVGGATTQSQTFEQVYTYWSYGARIGHMELSRSESKAPETFSYLDIAIGPYSSLESYVCHSNFETTESAPPGSSCSQYTHSPYHLTNPIDSRKRLYRFDIEGLLKIPKTVLYVGLNANIGQKTLGASQLDHGFAAPDDIRFLFGTKFDIASVLTKFKLGPQ